MRHHPHEKPLILKKLGAVSPAFQCSITGPSLSSLAQQVTATVCLDATLHDIHCLDCLMR